MNVKFNCETGCDIDYGLMDGYSFGDRLLEGVMFECRLNDNKHSKWNERWAVKVEADSIPYFSRLNQEMWLDEAQKFCAQNDIWECPICKQDVYPKGY